MKTAAVVLCALLLAGCGSTGGPAKAHPSSAASGGLAGGAPPAPRFDPPHRFAEASAVIDGGPLVVLDGVAYYYTSDGPAAADPATCRPRAAVRLPGTPPGPRIRPVVRAGPAVDRRLPGMERTRGGDRFARPVTRVHARRPRPRRHRPYGGRPGNDDAHRDRDRPADRRCPPRTRLPL